MTVQELMAKLEDCDPRAVVVVNMDLNELANGFEAISVVQTQVIRHEDGRHSEAAFDSYTDEDLKEYGGTRPYVVSITASSK